MKTTKSKLHIPAGVLLILFLSLSHSFAQRYLGISSPPPSSPGAPAFDPTTGQPIAPAPPPTWKDDDWKDPDITLAKVSYADLPLSEIARNLRAQFKDQFDILLPAPSTGNNIFNDITGLPQPDTDWESMPVRLELRNVTASEIFNAMNLTFENDQTPLRWELRVNGRRQIAVLHVLVHVPDFVAVRQQQMPPAPQEVRKVYFVGDLIGDEKNGGMSMQDIIKILTDVWKMSGDSGGKIQFHEEAQLLIVSGSPNQVGFLEQTLNALRQKVNLARDKHATIKMGTSSSGGGSGGGGAQNN